MIERLRRWWWITSLRRANKKHNRTIQHQLWLWDRQTQRERGEL